MDKQMGTRSTTLSMYPVPELRTFGTLRQLPHLVRSGVLRYSVVHVETQNENTQALLREFNGSQVTPDGTQP